ncbi:MAG TPA: acyl-CoA desaturase [Trebonia sp.]|jgi:stearoyl-CoA desaturase (delta-9 desaturase)|nr:acyl-CoA desaturase [Trebonia sp.]
MPTTPDASIDPRTALPPRPSVATASPAAPAAPTRVPRPAPRPDVEEDKATTVQQVALALFVGIPFLAVLAAIPFAWGWGLGWHDVVIGLVFYYVSGMGITVGYHRYFTHSSFKANRALRTGLAIAGSLAIEGPVITWVSDHRRHHKYSDKEGDPHSPWRFGTSAGALFKGLCFAHVGWLFDPNKTSQEKFSPDLLADSGIRKVDDFFIGWVAISLLAPALAGGLWGLSWHGALTAFFWASLVRIALLHHVTWSINSVCHVFGKEEFAARDKSRNVSWLAILSFGESWHNLHHADPTCARHGALRGQVDSSARAIWIFEKLGWAYDVRWPDEERLGTKRPATATRTLGSMTKQAAARSTARNAARGSASGEKSIKAAQHADKRAA